MRIVSEDPIRDQWRLLSQLSYHRNIEKHFGSTAVSTETVEFIAGSLVQGQSYFEAAQDVSLQIRPLLLYYGTANLLAGVATLLTGNVLDITHHGMKLSTPIPKDELAQTAFTTLNPNSGALHKFSGIFDSEDVNGTSWLLGEILGSVPDLLAEYMDCYSSAQPFVIPVEVVRTPNGIVERIEPTSINRFPSISDALSRVANLNEYYLPPQHSPQMNYIVLRRKIGARGDNGIYSVSGRKFLQLMYSKRRNIAPKPLILMFMGLFVLGTLSRYHPQVWNPFVRSDVTGERLVVEKFLDTCERQVPNLVLESLKAERVEFVRGTDGFVDLTVDSKTF